MKKTNSIFFAVIRLAISVSVWAIYSAHVTMNKYVVCSQLNVSGQQELPIANETLQITFGEDNFLTNGYISLNGETEVLIPLTEQEITYSHTGECFIGDARMRLVESDNYLDGVVRLQTEDGKYMVMLHKTLSAGQSLMGTEEATAETVETVKAKFEEIYNGVSLKNADEEKIVTLNGIELRSQNFVMTNNVIKFVEPEGDNIYISIHSGNLTGAGIDKEITLENGLVFKYSSDKSYSDESGYIPFFIETESNSYVKFLVKSEEQLTKIFKGV